MTRISHWHHVQGSEYIDANGTRRRSAVSYAVYDDDLTPCEREMKRIHTAERRLEAQAMVAEQYTLTIRRMEELQKVLGAPKEAVRISNRPGRWHD